MKLAVFQEGPWPRHRLQVAYIKCLVRVAETLCRLVQKEVPTGLLALGSFRLDAGVSHLRL